MKELKVTKEMVNKSRHQGHSVHGSFKGFCDLHSCCEECNKKVKFWCKVKTKIEDIQTRIIDKNCK
jgi:hypothetical protein